MLTLRQGKNLFKFALIICFSEKNALAIFSITWMTRVWTVLQYLKYSGDLKSDHSKSGNIQNPDFLKIRFQMVRFSKGRAVAKAMVPTIPKPDHSKSGHFCLDFKWFRQNGNHLCEFQMVGLPDFRSHLKSGPFANQPLFDLSGFYLNTRRPKYSKCLNMYQYFTSFHDYLVRVSDAFPILVQKVWNRTYSLVFRWHLKTLSQQD